MLAVYTCALFSPSTNGNNNRSLHNVVCKDLKKSISKVLSMGLRHSNCPINTVLIITLLIIITAIITIVTMPCVCTSRVWKKRNPEFGALGRHLRLSTPPPQWGGLQGSRTSGCWMPKESPVHPRAAHHPKRPQPQKVSVTLEPKPTSLD